MGWREALGATWFPSHLRDTKNKNKKELYLSIIRHHILLSAVAFVEALVKIHELARNKHNNAARTRIRCGKALRRHITKITPDWGNSDYHDGANATEK
jgi:hypothetical protein